MALAGGIRRYTPALNRIGGGGAPTSTALQQQQAPKPAMPAPPPQPSAGAGMVNAAMAGMTQGQKMLYGASQARQGNATPGQQVSMPQQPQMPQQLGGLGYGGGGSFAVSANPYDPSRMAALEQLRRINPNPTSGTGPVMNQAFGGGGQADAQRAAFYAGAGVGADGGMVGNLTAESTRMQGAPAAQAGQVRNTAVGGNIYGTTGQSNLPANPQYNPMQGQPISEWPISNEARNTFADWQFMPSVGGRQYQNPTDQYAGVMPGANQNLNQFFGGNMGGPYGQIGKDLLMNPPQGGQAPNAPNLMGPNIQNPNYQAQFNYAGGGGTPFDPNSVQGPNVPQVGGANRSDFQGPQMNVPTLQELVGMAGQVGGGAPNVPREQLQGSGFQQNQIFGNPNAISTRGFEGALGGATAQQGAGVDQGILGEQLDAIKAQQQQGLQDAARLGLQSTMRQGVYDPGSSIAGSNVGGEIARVLPEFQKQMADARLSAADRAIQQQQFGTSTLAGLGSAGANAAQGNAALLQGETSDLNRLGVDQRGQDVDLARLAGQLGGQNLGGIADLLRAQTGAVTDTFNAGTGRGSAIGNLDIEAGKANQDAALRQYNEQTGRMGTIGDIYNRQDQTGVDRFRAETERGLGEERARNEAARLGLDWESMNADQRNQFNQRLNEQYQTSAGMYGDRLRNQADIYGTQIQGASNFYRDTQSGQIDQARIAADLMSGSAQAQQAFQEMLQRGDIQDQNTLAQMIMAYRQGFINRANNRESARSDVIGGGLAGLGSAIGGL